MSGELTKAGWCVRWAVAGVAALAGWCPGAWAQTTPEFDAWWAKITAGGAGGPLPDGVSLSFTIIETPRLSDQELAELKRRIESFPEHPQKREIELERERREGRAKADITIWRVGSSFRYNKTFPNGQYSDDAWANGVGWVLTPSALVVGKEDGLRAHNVPIFDTISNLSMYSALLINGDITSFLMIDGVITPKLAADGSTWSAEGEAEFGGSPIRIQASGDWVSSGWGTVRRVQWKSTLENNGSWPLAARMDDWRFEAALGVGVAGRAELTGPPGRPPTVVENVRVVTFSPAEFAELVRIPQIGVADAVRGRATFTSIRELSEDLDLIKRVDQGGEVAVVHERPPPMTPGSQRSGVLQVLGWCVLGAIAALLIGLRLRQPSP